MNGRVNEVLPEMSGLEQLTDLIISQIRKLAELHQEGILSDDEFQSKKTELLSRF